MVYHDPPQGDAANVAAFVTSKAHACRVNTLPVELLSRVFEFGGGSEENNMTILPWDRFRFRLLESNVRRHPSPNSPPFRVAISLVCCHWYHVAISTSSLWTIINRFENSPDSFKRLQTSLAQSRGQPLELELCHYIETNPLARAYRGYVPLPCYEEQYIKFFRANLVPRLRTMRLSNCRINWADPWVSSLWNLTILELHHPNEFVRPSWTQLITMLRSTLYLKKLALCGAGSYDGPDNSDDNTESTGGHTNIPVSLLNLTDLMLAEENPDCAEGLLCMLHMPALKRLSLDLNDEDYSWSTFFRLLTGPATLPTMPSAAVEQHSLLNQLEYLHIGSFDCSSVATLKTLYDGLRNLTHLYLCPPEIPTYNPGYDALFDLLLPSSTDTATVRLPRLKTLVLGGLVGSVTDIYDIVRCRENAGFPLENIYM